MRIALSFPDCHRLGGVERVMYECGRYLANRGHDVCIYAQSREAEAPGNVRFRRVPSGNLPALMRLGTFARQCRRVMAASPPDVNCTFGCVCPTGGLLWVQSVHAAWIERSRALRPALSWGALRQRLNPVHPLILKMEKHHFAGRMYRKVIALTSDVREDLHRFYGVPNEDVVVLSNGFAPDEFDWARTQGERESVRHNLKYVPSDRVVIFAANETERKGFGPLIRAIASLRDERIHLLAVGRLNPAPFRNELARLGLAERVRFTGSSSRVAEYYAAADVFALPTQYEAWGLVITEAMACGLPVLTSRLAGAAVAVREGVTGELLDDPSDVAEIATKLGRLLDGSYEGPEAIARSVERYAWPNILAKYEALIQEVCGRC